MKKVLLGVLAVVLMAGQVWAAQTQDDVISEQLTISNTAVEGDISVADAKRVAFFVTNDSSIATEGITCSVTAAISLDGVFWQDINWYDIAGTTTKQSSEDLHGAADGSGYIGDGYYYAWFDEEMAMPMLRFRVTLDSTAASQVGSAAYNEVTVTIVQDK